MKIEIFKKIQMVIRTTCDVYAYFKTTGVSYGIANFLNQTEHQTHHFSV